MINDVYLQNGCAREIKECGFTVSYLSKTGKKTLANFVCGYGGELFLYSRIDSKRIVRIRAGGKTVRVIDI